MNNGTFRTLSFDVCFAMLATRKKLFSLVGLIGSRSLASSSTTFKNAEISQFLSERIVERKNGKKEKRLFSDKEYDRRLSNLRLV